jgi:uncharacterized membrane protein (DUF485 family)
MDVTTAARIRGNPQFVELERKRKSFGWLLTAIMLVIYYGFVALVAFAPAMIGRNVGGAVTLGLPLGIAVILSAIVLTGIYVWRANGEFDSLQRQVVAANLGARVKEDVL